MADVWLIHTYPVALQCWCVEHSKCRCYAIQLFALSPGLGSKDFLEADHDKQDTQQRQLLQRRNIYSEVMPEIDSQVAYVSGPQVTPLFECCQRRRGDDTVDHIGSDTK